MVDQRDISNIEKIAKGHFETFSVAKLGYVLVDPHGNWDVQSVASTVFDAKVFGLSLIYDKNQGSMNAARIERMWKDVENLGYSIKPVSIQLNTGIPS
jgi:hypothetical protein